MKKTTVSALIISALTLFLSGYSYAQQLQKGLLWEITGNGLKKPSYLYGTMHVSNKLAFNLSDSFFIAIKNSDRVALESSPENWLEELMSTEFMSQITMAQITGKASSFDPIVTSDFSWFKEFYSKTYIRQALAKDPSMLNQLMFRHSYSGQEFEEDTYLDLYIFQTASRLHKPVVSVEDLDESLKLVMQAYTDMYPEDKEKKYNPDFDKLLEEYYRQNDLNLMDSLMHKQGYSETYHENMLYIRNKNMVHRMDSIMNLGPLFTGVGAAHLPGEKGVISLLRKMGYSVRAVNLGQRNASTRNKLDKIEVPLTYRKFTSSDGIFSVSVPGKLLVMPDNAMSQQYVYTDMMNGSFYAVTRIKTLAAFNNYNEEQFKQSVDSLLYENIPGNTLSMKSIVVKGLKGYDITNKTRRGDLQYYRIIFTPFELFIAKTGGKNNYVKKNGLQFIQSFEVNTVAAPSQAFHNTEDGFEIKIPAPVISNVEKTALENYSPNTHVFQAEADGVKYFMLKQTKTNSSYLEEDSIEINMMARGFIEGTGYTGTARNYSAKNGYPYLSCDFAHPDGKQMHAFFIMKGAHVYVFSAWAQNAAGIDKAKEVFKTFRLIPMISREGKEINDTIHKFKTISPVKMPPDVNLFASAFKKRENKFNHRSQSETITYSDGATGERITVEYYRFHKFYQAKDTAVFWKNELENNLNEDLVRKIKYSTKEGAMYADVICTDTNSSKVIIIKAISKGRYLYKLTAQSDTITKGNNFVRSFFDSFQATDTSLFNVFSDKSKQLLADLLSSDSATYAQARELIAVTRLFSKTYKPIAETFEKLKDDKYKKELQQELITEIGYTKDVSAIPYLKDLYKKSEDDYDLQLTTLRSLIVINTIASYKMCKELLVSDPPFATDEYRYSHLFDFIQSDDSLWNRKVFIPDVLKLAANDEYKLYVYDMLAEVIDSNKVTSAQYQPYLATIIADARKAVKREITKDAEESSATYNYELSVYNRIMIKHYDTHAEVRDYFDKQLKSKNYYVKSSAIGILVSKNKPVHDSIIYNMSSNVDQRVTFYRELKRYKKENKMPTEFRTQQALAYCSARVSVKPSYGDNTLDTLIMLDSGTTYFKGRFGKVYFFKYKLKKSDDWNTYLCGVFNDKTSEFEFTRMISGKGKVFDEKKNIAEQMFALTEDMKERNRVNYSSGDYEYDYDEAAYDYEE